MHRARSLGLRVVVVCIIVLTCIGWSQGVASAGNPKYCSKNIDKLDNQNFGVDVPVILVNGVNGDKGDWGRPGREGFYKTIDDLPGVSVAQAFDYDARWNNIAVRWIDDKNIGPKLANTIDCVAQLSLKNGGKGKVVVVGYSLGGLVARYALSLRSSDGRQIADEVGQAVMIATPNRGTMTWPISNMNDKIDALPHMPPQVITHTIAGDVERVYVDVHGKEIRREHPYDDTLVTVYSAAAEYSGLAQIGGDSHVVQCEKIYRERWHRIGYDESTASCEHGQMIRNAKNGVWQNTTDAIGKYVASLNRETQTLTVHSLTLKYDLTDWPDAGYGVAGPDNDIEATDAATKTACTNCSNVPPPMVHAFSQVLYLGDACASSIATCALGSDRNIVGTAPSVAIGGRSPDFSAQYKENNDTYGPNLVWCFSSKQICIYYRWAADAQLNPSPALLRLFSNAVWSD